MKIPQNIRIKSIFLPKMYCIDLKKKKKRTTYLGVNFLQYTAIYGHLEPQVFAQPLSYYYIWQACRAYFSSFTFKKIIIIIIFHKRDQ
jgi:hypothetical protein